MKEDAAQKLERLMSSLILSTSGQTKCLISKEIQTNLEIKLDGSLRYRLTP